MIVGGPSDAGVRGMKSRAMRSLVPSHTRAVHLAMPSMSGGFPHSNKTGSAAPGDAGASGLLASAFEARVGHES